MSSQVPWSRIREFKEQEEKKRRRELEQAMGIAPTTPAAAVPSAAVAGVGGVGAGPLSQQEQQAQAREQAEGIVDRFDQAYMKDRLLFGGIVGSVTGAFFGGLDAVQGIKKGQAFGVALSTTKAKARFTAEHVGAASLTFGLFYSMYQGIKYISRVARGEDDWGNPTTAGLLTVGPLLASATFRRNVPYAVLLIGMDVVSEASSS